MLRKKLPKSKVGWELVQALRGVCLLEGFNTQLKKHLHGGSSMQLILCLPLQVLPIPQAGLAMSLGL